MKIDVTLLGDLINVIDCEIPHDYQGLCPDESQPGSMDEDCPACKITIKAKKLLGIKR